MRSRAPRAQVRPEVAPHAGERVQLAGEAVGRQGLLLPPPHIHHHTRLDHHGRSHLAQVARQVVLLALLLVRNLNDHVLQRRVLAATLVVRSSHQLSGSSSTHLHFHAFFYFSNLFFFN